MTSATEAPAPQPSTKRRATPRRAERDLLSAAPPDSAPPAPPSPPPPLPAPPDSAAPEAEPAAFAPLATERLLLRPLIAADAPTLHNLVNNWEVACSLANVPFPYPRALADEWIASTTRELAAGTAYHLAITGRDGATETLVGVVGLRADAAARTGRLGYWVGHGFWGHGVATEAAGRLARWALANLDLDRLEATVVADNPASLAVLRRIGFRETGRGTETFRARGGRQPVVLLTATREDLFGKADAPAPGSVPLPPGATAAAPDGAKPLVLVAACALIDRDGRVLLARRPEGKTMAGLWEFPGGKLAPGETPEAALIRELKEELGIDVTASCLGAFAFASHAYERFHLLMPLFLLHKLVQQHS